MLAATADSDDKPVEACLPRVERVLEIESSEMAGPWCLNTTSGSMRLPLCDCGDGGIFVVFSSGTGRSVAVGIGLAGIKSVIGRGVVVQM